MLRLVLSPDESTRLEQTRRTQPPLAERCHYVLLNAQGWSVPHIAPRLDRNEHTIRTWRTAYRAEGLAGLRTTPPPGRPATQGQGVTPQIEHLLVHSPSHFGSMEEGWTVALICDYLAQHQEAVSDATVRRQLQAGDWVYKRFANTVPRNAPTAEEKKRGGQQLSPPLRRAKRSGQ
jgi:transposase